MSGLARILLDRGYKISGSDKNQSSITDELKKDGAEIFIGHEGRNVKNADVVVVTAAVNDSNPEVKSAKENNISILRRSELLGQLMTEKKGIAVAGTHGKTTTSTMLSLVLENAGLDPAMAIGGEVKNIGGNAKDGNGEYFVAEACEYDRSFLDLHPYAAIITNIEEDHLDTYGDLKHILESFREFVGQIDPKGFLIVSEWDNNIKEITSAYHGKLITYGLSEGEFRASDVRVCGHTTVFGVKKGSEYLGDITLIIPGAHNILNALAVCACALEIGVPFKKIVETLRQFTGAKRRFEIKGEKNGILVIDDYAHHPTEIQATLDGLKSFYPQSKAWCVFQAHQYSRTRFLLSDFAKSFKNIDHVIIPEIYEARDSEADKKAINCQILADEIEKVSHNAICIPEFGKVVEYLKKNAKEGDIITTIGAGPVYRVGEEFLK